MPDIASLDADVITLEASRGDMDLLKGFSDFRYPNEIGPGVYDIHSPRAPSVDEMVALLQRMAGVIPPEQLWVNPDCGLKTRQWREVIEALSKYGGQRQSHAQGDVLTLNMRLCRRTCAERVPRSVFGMGLGFCGYSYFYDDAGGRCAGSHSACRFFQVGGHGISRRHGWRR